MGGITSSLLEAALKVKTAVEKTSSPSTPAKVTQTVRRGPGNKGKTYPASPPSPDDMRAILDATFHPDMRLSRKLGLLGLRNRALFVCLWRSGLRIHEALLLTPDDLDFEHCTVTVRRGKGGKRRDHRDLPDGDRARGSHRRDGGEVVVTPRGIKPIVREPALTAEELAAVPSDQHCDALLLIEQALEATPTEGEVSK